MALAAKRARVACDVRHSCCPDRETSCSLCVNRATFRWIRLTQQRTVVAPQRSPMPHRLTANRAADVRARLHPNGNVGTNMLWPVLLALKAYVLPDDCFAFHSSDDSFALHSLLGGRMRSAVNLVGAVQCCACAELREKRWMLELLWQSNRRSRSVGCRHLLRWKRLVVLLSVLCRASF